MMVLKIQTAPLRRSLELAQIYREFDREMSHGRPLVSLIDWMLSVRDANANRPQRILAVTLSDECQYFNCPQLIYTKQRSNIGQCQAFLERVLLWD